MFNILDMFRSKAFGKVTGFSYSSVTSMFKIYLPKEPCHEVLSHILLYRIYSGIYIISPI